MMNISQAAVKKLTAPWEEFVAYPYDDKAGKVRVGGHWQYPEWTGGGRGTPTVGFGHTNAAGAPRVVPGMRLTEEQAWALLAHDLAPCVARVNRFLKVPVSQHTFDGLVDFDFNCPSGTQRLCNLINAGNRDGVNRAMLQYIYSKGERMQGLIHRRNAEISWMSTPDNPEEAASTITNPKAEEEPPPHTMATSKTGAAAIAVGSSGGASILAGIQAASDATDPIKHLNDNLSSLGIMGHLDHIAHSPGGLIVLGAVIVALAAFLWWDRRYKLVNWHV